jgi:hypothetical protein
MTNAEASTLVLKDQAGDYFLLPQDALEQCRVSGERKAEIERLMDESDVSGHLFWAYVLYRGIKDGVNAIRESGSTSPPPPPPSGR